MQTFKLLLVCVSLLFLDACKKLNQSPVSESSSPSEEANSSQDSNLNNAIDLANLEEIVVFRSSDTRSTQEAVSTDVTANPTALQLEDMNSQANIEIVVGGLVGGTILAGLLAVTLGRRAAPKELQDVRAGKPVMTPSSRKTQLPSSQPQPTQVSISPTLASANPGSTSTVIKVTGTEGVERNVPIRVGNSQAPTEDLIPHTNGNSTLGVFDKPSDAQRTHDDLVDPNKTPSDYALSVNRPEEHSVVVTNYGKKNMSQSSFTGDLSDLNEAKAKGDLGPMKKLIFDKANQYFESVPAQDKQFEVFSLQNRDDYFLRDASERQPAYFKDPTKGKNFNIQVENNKGLYNYSEASDAKHEVYYVDFANKKLGGGFAQDRGFVQEEIMFTMMPQLASYALHHTKTSPVITRSGDSEGVMRGSPDPKIFKGVSKVAEFNTDSINGGQKGTPQGSIYGEGFQYFKADDPVAGLNQRFIQTPPQRVNIIASAAPNLRSRDNAISDQFDPRTVADLFNTSYAHSKLAVDASRQGVHIVTGRLGAGVFGNSVIGVNVIQQLAAREAGVAKISFYAYSDAQQKVANSIVKEILDKNPKTIDELINITATVLKSKEQEIKRVEKSN